MSIGIDSWVRKQKRKKPIENPYLFITKNKNKHKNGRQIRIRLNYFLKSTNLILSFVFKAVDILSKNPTFRLSTDIALLC